MEGDKKDEAQEKNLLVEEEVNGKAIAFKDETNDETKKEEIDPDMIKYLSKIKDVFFVFTNPLSGNQEGTYFLNLAEKYTCDTRYKIIDFGSVEGFKFENPIIAYFFKMIDEDDKKIGRKIIRNYQNSTTENLKVLIAGGDGSNLTTVEELVKDNIDVNKCIFGHVPLGTGNDFANALGFGSSVNISNDLNKLYNILNKYYISKPCKMDVWNFELQLDNEKGQILMNTKNGKIPMTDKTTNNIIRNYSRSFVNYMSLGYDARVGYCFDAKRSNSRCKNKCIYCWEGCKKICCTKTLPVSGFLDSFTVLENTEASMNENTFLSANKSTFVNQNGSILTGNVEDLEKNPENIKVKFCFRPENLVEKENLDKKCIVMKGTPAAIICQNINFYMSGCKDIWVNSGDSCGLEILNKKQTDKKDEKDKLDENKYKQKLANMMNEEQTFSDHKLEFFCFNSSLKLGLENVFHGMATKLYHGRTPIVMKFVDTPEKIDGDTYNRVYLDIDGEYYHIVKPKYIKVDLNRSYNNGNLNYFRYIPPE